MEPYGDAERGLACPERADLLAFCRGGLSGPAFECIASHLSACAECESIFAELSSLSSDDLLSRQIRRCLAAPVAPTDPACEAMERAARDFGPPSAIAPTGHPVSHDWSDPVPETVGPYEILSAVGRGGMGIVYRARHQAVRREVALKMLRAGVHARADARARFRVEAEAIARMAHPNIVQFYEYGESGGLPYFAMEWVEGESLAQRLNQGPLPAREAATLVRTLALAVESAHQKKVLHRDLKPSNVLLTHDSQPKISDYGLAKLIDDGGEGLTQSDVVVGTLSYMAPEQAAGKPADVGAAADIYGLGAILFEALAGEPPFKGPNPLETLRRVREDEPAPPSRKRAGIPAALDLICLKCLEKAATRRYPSAQALAADLDQWLQTGHIGRAARARRWLRNLWRRRRAGLAGLMLSGALLALALRDPERPLRKMQDDLRQGRAVTLIQDGGKPTWYRWKTGESKSRISPSGPRSFTIHTWGLGLLELLPDPQVERYRFDVDVKHESSDLPGRAGLFVARSAYPGGGSDIHFFTQVTFNDVRRETDFLHVPLPDHFPVPKPRDTSSPPLNAVTIAARLHSEQGAPSSVDRHLFDHFGPRFAPAGEGLTEWHHLTVTVAPDGVEAQWDGQPFSMTAVEIGQATEVGTKKLRQLFAKNPSVQTLHPTFSPRGGLGLFLLRGSASFRAAKVTPLQAGNRPIPNATRRDPHG